MTPTPNASVDRSPRQRDRHGRPREARRSAAGVHVGTVVAAIAAAAACTGGASAYDPPDYWMRHHQTEAQYQDFYDNQLPDGYRPVFATADGSGANERYCVVAVDDPGVPWRARHDMSPATYQDEVDQQVADGYRLLSVDGYGTNANPLLIAIWVKDGLPAADWGASHGMDWNEFTQTVVDVRNAGYRMTWLAGYGSGGSRRFAAIWVRNDEGWSWSVFADMSPAGYQGFIETTVENGMRPICVSGYGTSSNPQMAAIFLRPDGPGWEIQPQWQARHDLGVDGFQEYVEEVYEDRRWRPRCITPYDDPGARFAIVYDYDEGPRQWTAKGEPTPELQHLEDIVKSYMQSRKIARGTIAVTYDDRLVLHRAYTWAGDDVPPTQTHHRFRMASISKPITAVTVLRLVEDGLIGEAGDSFNERLDTRLVEIPGFDAGDWSDPAVDDVTIRHLLQHVAGWDRDASFDPMFRDETIAGALGVPLPISIDDVIAYMQGIDLDFLPGADFAYSNFGYALLGKVIEAVTGEPYETAVRSRTLCRVGATGMALGRTLPEDRPAGEVDYRDPMNRWRTSVMGGGDDVRFPDGAMNVDNFAAHGGWTATAEELARFVNDFADATASEILGPTSVAFMWDPTPQSDGKWGAGWRIRSGYVEHGGSMPGTYGTMIRRDDGVTIVALFNQRSSDAETPVQDLDGEIRQMLVDAVVSDGSWYWPLHDLFDDVDVCASGRHEEGFDTVPAGLLRGLRGWEAKDDADEHGRFFVVDDVARSVPHALEIDGDDGAILRIHGADDGQWRFEAWTFVPATMAAAPSIALLNREHPEVAADRSVEVILDGTSNTVRDLGSGAELPLIRGAWVPLVVEIDLGADLQRVLYDGGLLVETSWTSGVAPGGAAVIAGLLLEGDGTIDPMFVDDLVLERAGCTAEDGDLDGDGAIGFGDLVTMLAQWGACPPGAPCPADLDGDGAIGFGDLVILLTGWGDCD